MLQIIDAQGAPRCSCFPESGRSQSEWMSDPEVLESVRVIHGQRTVMQPHTQRVNRPDLFEAERRAVGIRVPEVEILVRTFTDGLREPESGNAAIINPAINY